MIVFRLRIDSLLLWIVRNLKFQFKYWSWSIHKQSHGNLRRADFGADSLIFFRLLFLAMEYKLKLKNSNKTPYYLKARISVSLEASVGENAP